jgi:hypothetical protein
LPKLVLNTSVDTDFKLIGLNASIEPFKLAFLINKNLNTQFKRARYDVEMFSKNNITYFALFSYCDLKTSCNLYLVQNKSKYIDQSPKFVSTLFDDQEQSIRTNLINSHKHSDYLIKVEDEFDRFKVKKMVLELNDIRQIISAYEILAEDVKTPENLIFK